jgi:hypothetical protein
MDQAAEVAPHAFDFIDMAFSVDLVTDALAGDEAAKDGG